MAEDTLENDWGVHLITHTERRHGRRTFGGFSVDLENAVKGYKLNSVHMCGTDANKQALCLCTETDYSRCLFGIGCYVGGDKVHSEISTSGYTPKQLLAMPKKHCEVSPSFKYHLQTVPLPYHVPSTWLEESGGLQEHEDHCLRHLHELLMNGLFAGQAYRVILLEYILAGNGGMLSHRYLLQLAKLLKQFDVVIVADEILTGGRVGPELTMTTTMPPEVQERVHYITLGKFLGAGVVLEKKPNKPTDVGPDYRGFSTQADCGLPSKILNEVMQRIDAGLIQERKAAVLKMMEVKGKGKAKTTSEHFWGEGLLMFYSSGRGMVTKGLKCRGLPRLERTRLVKLNPKKSHWTRSTVCKTLFATTRGWMENQRILLLEGDRCFTFLVVNYISIRQQTQVHGKDNSFCFHAEEVVEFVGEEVSHCYARRFRSPLTGRELEASPLRMFNRAIKESVLNTKDCHALYRKRVGSRRIQYTFVNEKYLLSSGMGGQPIRLKCHPMSIQWKSQAPSADSIKVGIL